MMNFFVTGSEQWENDDSGNTLHDQLFGHVTPDSNFCVSISKRTKTKSKKKIHGSVEFQLDDGAHHTDFSATKVKNNKVKAASNEALSPKRIIKTKVTKMKHKKFSNESDFEGKYAISGSEKELNIESALLQHTQIKTCNWSLLNNQSKKKRRGNANKTNYELQESIPSGEVTVSEFHNSKSKKGKKRKIVKESLDAISNNKRSAFIVDTKNKSFSAVTINQLNPSKLQQIFQKYSVENSDTAIDGTDPPESRSSLLKKNATKCLQAAKFRFLNEKMYSSTGHEALKYFQSDHEAFQEYHQGYQSQVAKWPMNPVDLIISDIQKRPKSLVIADLGCGDAKIARVFPKRTVHSFDLVALNDCVTCCDISKVPLSSESVDIAVFCLSLMGINLSDYILEVRRILKNGGLLKIAEVESRIEDLPSFIVNIEKYGFSLLSQDTKHKMFVFMDFNKVQKNLKKSKLPVIEMNPCVYKKR